MAASFLITLREGLEASLIVGILITYLVRIGQRRHVGKVLWAVVAALLASGLLALAIHLTLGSFEGATEKIFEGCLMLLAAGVLTYMVFWMHQHSRRLKGELQRRVDLALSGGSLWALFTLGFISVLREGVETVLFLSALARQEGGASLLGAGLGLLVAVGLGAAFFLGARRIDLRPFFLLTGALLLLLAGGLLAHGIHEFVSVGWLPPLVDEVYSWESWLPEKEGIGVFLRALFGYDSNPSGLVFISYWIYVIAILSALWVRSQRPAEA